MVAVGRLDDRSGRWYVDPLDPELRYESVTSILSAATSKPWLTQWTAKLAAQWAAEHLDFLVATRTEAGQGAVVDLIKGAAGRLRDLKADIGTHQHDVLEALLLDAPIPDVPAHLVDVEVEGERVDQDAISDGLVNFLTDFDVTPVMSEATVASVVYGYAGTLDMVADFGRPPLPHMRRLLVDCKTGTNLERTMRAQLAAYRRADEVWLDHLGNRAVMPKVDGTAVLHLRREHPGGYRLVPMDDDVDAFEEFLTCQRRLKQAAAAERITRRAWYPPQADGTQPPPPLSDVEHPGLGRCRRALARAGVLTLAQLAEHTPVSLRALAGIGPAALDACVEVLAEHGLALREAVLA